jgi:chemotaxis protein MotB
MTYADFITLMMIFFIVIYTFTPGVESSKFEQIIGAFNGKRGVLDKESVFSDEMLDVKVQVAKKNAKKEQAASGLQQYIAEHELGDEVQIELLPEGILIILGESISFPTYSAQLMDESKAVLDVVVEMISKYTFEELLEIEVQGHTDNRPIRAGARRYQTNWELGAARAASVLRYLNENSEIEPGKFKASTYGEHKPLVNNATADNRAKNRRVEIYIRYSPDDNQNSEVLMKETFITE